MLSTPAMLVLAALAVVVILFIIGRIANGSRSEQPTQPEPDPTRYRVRLFSGGEVVRTFETTEEFEYGDGEAVFYDDDGNIKRVITGTFAIEPILPGVNFTSPSSTEGDTTYKVTLYDGAKEVGSWVTTEYETSNGQAVIYLPGRDETVIAQGTMLIEELA